MYIPAPPGMNLFCFYTSAPGDARGTATPRLGRSRAGSGEPRPRPWRRASPHHGRRKRRQPSWYAGRPLQTPHRGADKRQPARRPRERSGRPSRVTAEEAQGERHVGMAPLRRETTPRRASETAPRRRGSFGAQHEGGDGQRRRGTQRGEGRIWPCQGDCGERRQQGWRGNAARALFGRSVAWTAIWKWEYGSRSTGGL